jgi:MFS family permease
MLAVQVMIAFTSQTGPVVAPVAAKDLGVEAHLVGYYVAVAYACAATAGLVSGNFIARYGAIRTSQVCLSLCTLGMTLAATGNPGLVLLSALVVGFGYGPATPASSHILARVTPASSLNLVFSIKQTGVPLGAGLAGAVVPSLALGMGWQASCAAIGAASLALALSIQPWRERFDAGRDRERRPFAFGQSALVIFQIWRIAPIRRLAVTSLAFSGMQVCVSAFLVIYLHEQCGLPVVTAGLLLSVTQTGGVIGRIVWGTVADRTGRPLLLLGGLAFAMTVCALVATTFDASWPLGMIGVVVFVFGGTAIAWNGVHLAQVARHAPAGKAGEITGGTSFFTFGGVVVVPSIFSAVLSGTGSYAVAFGLAAVATFVAGLTLVASARSGLRAPPPAA